MEQWQRYTKNLYFSSWTYTNLSKAASDGEEASDGVECGEGPALGWASSGGSVDFSKNSLHGSWTLWWNPCKDHKKNMEAAHLVQGASWRMSQASSYSSSSCSWHRVLWHAVWVKGAWKHSVCCGQGSV